MILEAITNIQDQGITNLILKAHKVARTVMIDINPKMPHALHILPGSLVVNVPNLQRMLKLVMK